MADPATGKSFEKLHLAGEYTWLTYNQLAEKVEAFATGLVAATGVAKGEPVVIYAETKADWMVRSTGVAPCNARLALTLHLLPPCRWLPRPCSGRARW